MNRTFAVYGIRYIINKNFPQMFTNKKNSDLSLISEK